MARPADEPIRQSVTVGVPVGQAFAAFADLARWWPREYTWAGDTLEDNGIDPHEGGFCFERGPHGITCHWGRVLVWDPPTRLAFAWQVAPTAPPSPIRQGQRGRGPLPPLRLHELPGRPRAPRLHPLRRHPPLTPPL